MDLTVNKYYHKSDFLCQLRKDFIYLILEFKGNNIRKIDISKLADLLVDYASLQGLALDLRNNRIYNYEFSIICSGLQKCNKLKSFYLDLRRNRVDYLTDLNITLSNLKKLTHFNLNISAEKFKGYKDKMVNEEIPNMIKSLQKNLNLKEWKIYLKVVDQNYLSSFYIQADKINHSSYEILVKIKNLSFEIFKNSLPFQNLTTLVIMNQDCDTDLSLLNQSINLKIFVLDYTFYYFNQAQSEQFNTQLGNLLKNLKNLEILKVNLGQSNQNRIKNLFSNLEQPNKLRDLHIEFLFINKKAFENFQFAQLKNLKQLCLEITEGQNIDYSDLQDFITNLENCENLIVIKIKFQRISKLNLKINSSLKKAKRLVYFEVKPYHGYFTFEKFYPQPIKNDPYDFFKRQFKYETN